MSLLNMCKQCKKSAQGWQDAVNSDNEFTTKIYNDGKYISEYFGYSIGSTATATNGKMLRYIGKDEREFVNSGEKCKTMVVNCKLG